MEILNKLKGRNYLPNFGVASEMMNGYLKKFDEKITPLKKPQKKEETFLATTTLTYRRISMLAWLVQPKGGRPDLILLAHHSLNLRQGRTSSQFTRPSRISTTLSSSTP